MIPSESRLLRLLTWLTPAFAAGTVGYAHGLEAAIRERTVTDTRDLTAWISNLIEHGSGWTDAVLARAAWIAVTAEDHVALERIAALAEQQITSPHRRRESLAQGEAFLVAVAAWNPPPILSAPYPVAVGATAGAAGIPLEPALAAWLHAFAAHLTGLAMRAIPLGQSDAVAVIAGLERVILRTATRAAGATLDDLGAAVPDLSILPQRAAQR
ncbi:urease accessory protein UreF [Phenylobacterium sp.]|jgi:urease accessory protein|uniref:urease accessory protein UreF n=1 Tax=Phenylobacterium sp. TaxID=1871053 RepID=UPI0037C9DF24